MIDIADTDNIICNNDLPALVSLSCPAGVIDIPYANWGRSQPYAAVCPEPRGPNEDTWCYHSIADLLSACHGATSCEVPDLIFVGFDPCPDTGKYIQILYSCVPGKTGNCISYVIPNSNDFFKSQPKWTYITSRIQRLK